MSYRADKQVITAHTDGHTDRHNQRQYPKAKSGLGLRGNAPQSPII